jgi:hypothetical protein
MTKDEALDLALEALEESIDLVREDYENAKKLYSNYPSRQARLLGLEDGLSKHEAAIKAIKQARSAPVQDSTCSEALRAQGKAYPRTCRKCGKGPCIALVNAALDKKAENARELGLDYEPDYKVTVVDDQHPNGVPLEQWGRPAPDLQAELDATNRQVEILSDALAESRREVAALKAVQEPVAYRTWVDGWQYTETKGDGEALCLCNSPAAQPAVPDAFGTREGEHPEYIQGWNDCRAEMLKRRTA